MKLNILKIIVANALIWISSGCIATDTIVTKSWDAFSENKQNSIHAGLHWDTVGPVFNSGRVETLDVIADRPSTMYVGFGSGNLWKTVDHGLRWKPVFDDYAGYSIGDVCIAPSQTERVYLGTGENVRSKRGHTFPGAGMYRTDDGGENWVPLGLEGTFHISRVAVHPTDSKVVFVAALGHFFSDNKERGLYKSTNAGKTWEKVLYIDEQTGVSDVVFAPSDPSILYASTWQPNEAGGGPKCTVYKSTDSGDNWVKMDTGLPQGALNGRIGLAVSYQNKDRVYAFVDNLNRLENPGQSACELYRTDDGGKKWERTHEMELQIFSSFGHVFNDCRVNPSDDNDIYLVGIVILKSEDAGQSFTQLRGKIEHIHPSPAQSFHRDHHDLWINPNNPDHLIAGNDGGLYISYDQAQSWMHYNNMPVAEFYFVTTDNDKPYRIYSGSQDVAAVRGPAKPLTDITKDGWEYVWIDPWGGGDGLMVRPDPTDSDIVYWQSQRGEIHRKHMPSNQSTGIMPRLMKDNKDLLYHEWSTPYIISKYNHLTLYYASNFIHKSINRGDAWSIISPDLSLSKDPERSGNGVTVIQDSPITQGQLYAGTSKGAVWRSDNDGGSWTEISEGLPKAYVKNIEISRFDPSRVYITLNLISSDDFTPMVYVSDDKGQTWTSLIANLPKAPVNVVLEDPLYQDILYCGTFNGVFISLNRGKSWQVFGSKMPHIFVADMTIQAREKDLIVSTHGRGIYKMDLEPIYAHMANPDKPSILHVTEAVLPQKDASAQNIRLTSYVPVKFSMYLPQAGTMTFTASKPDGTVIDTRDFKIVKGFNTFSWDMVIKRDDQPYAPYHYKTHIFPEAGTYPITFETKDIQLKQSLLINEH